MLISVQPPLIDFDAFQSVSELNTVLEDSFDRLFPASKNISSLPPVEPIQNASAISHTDRSLSLWSQLLAPPPLQPQNWVKSRIRRLFLVSLGVPVDLDEILPASKQKKLVLPSIDLGSLAGSQQQQQQSQTKDGTKPTTHPDAASKTGTTIPPSPTSASTPTTSTQEQRYSRRRDNPPPELDLSAVGRLCATTDAALDGLTDEELKSHVSELQQVTQRASTVLEYWLKRLDGLIGEKEAFEGVIENLVSHARRVRK